MELLSGVNWGIAILVMAVGTAIQGSVGFGLALVAAPILAMLDPRLVPAPIMCSSTLLIGLMAFRERHAIAFADIGPVLVGRVFGTALGAALIAVLPPKPMALALGALVLIAVAMAASGLHVQATRWNLAGAGALSGFMGTSSSIGGPPLALVYQHRVGAQLRGTLAGHFMLGTVISLGALALVGRFGWDEFVAALQLVPGIVIGFVISLRTAKLLDKGYTRPAVLIVSAAAGAMLVAKQFL